MQREGGARHPPDANTEGGQVAQHSLLEGVDQAIGIGEKLHGAPKRAHSCFRRGNREERGGAPLTVSIKPFPE